MKPEIHLYTPPKDQQEKKKSSPEDVTLYSTGAGMYSYLNVLAQKLAIPDFDRKPFEMGQ